MVGEERFVNGHAVLIGVGGDLPVTERDATGVRDVLVDPRRGAYPPERVHLLTGSRATRAGVLDALDQLARDVVVEPDGVALVYYSGHGGRVEHDGHPHEYFLVPHGYDPADLAGTAITDVEFTARLEALESRRLMVFLDCCHAGGLPQLKAPGLKFTASPMGPAMLALLDQGSGSAVIASSREAEYSYTGADYSVFTECLLEALAGHGATSADGFARILNVLSYLFAEVPRRASAPQHPFVKKVIDLADNFPICYYAGGAKALPAGVASLPALPSLPDWKRDDLMSERAMLVASLETNRELLRRLRDALDLESEPARTLLYERQTFDRELRVAQATQELEAVDAALGKLSDA